ncbi:hypothetical protein HDU96_001379 [Phlyctochytrium bullatum]|nr:hypothetical protein HDU96_001379 [Phlyctochytrium bullatum]
MSEVVSREQEVEDLKRKEAEEASREHDRKRRELEEKRKAAKDAKEREQEEKRLKRQKLKEEKEARDAAKEAEKQQKKAAAEEAKRRKRVESPGGIEDPDQSHAPKRRRASVNDDGEHKSETSGTLAEMDMSEAPAAQRGIIAQLQPGNLNTPSDMPALKESAPSMQAEPTAAAPQPPIAPNAADSTAQKTNQPPAINIDAVLGANVPCLTPDDRQKVIEFLSGRYERRPQKVEIKLSETEVSDPNNNVSLHTLFIVLDYEACKWRKIIRKKKL